MGVWEDAGAAAGAGAGIGTAIAPGIGTVVGGAIGFAAPFIGQLIGNALGSGDRAKAQSILEDAYNRFGPDILKTPDVAGLTAHLDTSKMEGVQADAGSISVQRAALANLQRRGAQGPDNIEFRAGMDAATSAANQQAAGQNAALRNEMQARGRGNTGAEYATRALENQAAAERASSGGFQAAAEGNRQALQAIQAGGALAGQMRGQSFGEEATRAAAADERARFNAEHQVQGAQQAFQDRFAGAQAQSNAGANLANYYGGQAAQVQNMGANVGYGVGMAAGTLGQYATPEDRAYWDAQKKKTQPGSGGG